MKRNRRWARVLFVCFSAIVAVVLMVAEHFHIWNGNDLMAFRSVQRYGQLGDELWFRRIQGGESIETVLAIRKPHRERVVGRFVDYTFYPTDEYASAGLWFEGLSMQAYDGRVVGAVAWSCTWDYVFFDERSDALKLAYVITRECDYQEHSKVLRDGYEARIGIVGGSGLISTNGYLPRLDPPPEQ